MAGASRIGKLVKSNLLRVYDVDLLGLFYGFSQVSRCVRSTAVCSANFRRYLLLQLRNPYHIVSTVTAPQATAQLEVACPIFFALRDEHLYISIDLSVHFSPGQLAVAAAVASSAIPLLYFYPPHHSLTSTGWRRWWDRPPNSLACERPPRAPCPSPASSSSSSVRLIGCLCSLFSPCMHAPPPACLLRLLFAATFSPSRRHHQTWRWRASSP